MQVLCHMIAANYIPNHEIFFIVWRKLNTTFTATIYLYFQLCQRVCSLASSTFGTVDNKSDGIVVLRTVVTATTNEPIATRVTIAPHH